jgi:hypothetical protein
MRYKLQAIEINFKTPCTFFDRSPYYGPQFIAFCSLGLSLRKILKKIHYILFPNLPRFVKYEVGPESNEND